MISQHQKTSSFSSESIEGYSRAREQGLFPTIPALIAAIKACSGLRDVELGRSLHSDASSIGLDSNIFVANTLLDMYCKCGSLPEAKRVFDRIANPTLVSWNALISGYAQNGHPEAALEIFDRFLQLRRFTPDARTLTAVLKALSGMIDSRRNQVDRTCCLQKVAEVHRWVDELGYGGDVFLASSLVAVYSKYGSLVDARRVFYRMPRRDAVSWTSMITGVVQAGEFEAALDLFSRMQQDRVPSDCQTLAAVFKAIGGLVSGEEISDEERRVFLERGLELEKLASGMATDLVLESSLVDMFSKCGKISEARRVFDRMKRRDVVAWNSLLMGYAQVGDGEAAFELFHRMVEVERFAPDSKTYIAVLKSLSNLAAKVEPDKKLVHGKPVKLWCLETGRALHRKLASIENPGVYLLSTLIDMYSSCGSLEEALRVFEHSPRGEIDVVSWNSIILACAECGNNELALKLFESMVIDYYLVPDDGSFVAALKACSNLVAAEPGRRIHGEILRLGGENKVMVATHLVDFYGRCGRIGEADRIIDLVTLESRNSVAWNALLAGYSCQGDHHRVFDLLEVMKSGGVELNEMSYLCVLNSCSHGGLVGRARACFEGMRSCERRVEHYGCMVDLVGRLIGASQALEMVETMPFEANRSIWMSVMSSSEKWRNVEVGRIAFEKLLGFGNSSSGSEATAYVMMSNVYSKC